MSGLQKIMKEKKIKSMEIAIRRFIFTERFCFRRIHISSGYLYPQIIHYLLVSYTFNNLQIKFSTFDRNYYMYYSLFEGKGKRFFRYLLRRKGLCFKGMLSLKPDVDNRVN